MDRGHSTSSSPSRTEDGIAVLVSDSVHGPLQVAPRVSTRWQGGGMPNCVGVVGTFCERGGGCGLSGRLVLTACCGFSCLSFRHNRHVFSNQATTAFSLVASAVDGSHSIVRCVPFTGSGLLTTTRMAGVCDVGSHNPTTTLFLTPAPPPSRPNDTGRTHQIRLHLQKLGHPIANDPNYGSSTRLSVFVCVYVCV